MKVMILSDSHTISKNDLLALFKHNQADYYIHCGDIYMSYEKLNLNNFYLAKGNNDFNKNINDDLFITIDNLKFFITHGHRYNVNANLNYLYKTGEDKNADIICFGHTHRPYFKVHKKITMINPGSICYPRGQCCCATYCIFDTKNRKNIFYDANTFLPYNPFKKEPF
ncbi:YfcE family phosphodiesterase [Thomasclavelia sp.]